MELKQELIVENDLSNKIIGCALEVHKKLGPGLLESSYSECLYYELTQAGLFVLKEEPLPLIYKEVKMRVGYRLDLWVEKRVIIEVKAIEELHDVHLAQMLTYLKLTGNRLGLLLNFNVSKLKEGIKRVVF